MDWDTELLTLQVKKQAEEFVNMCDMFEAVAEGLREELLFLNWTLKWYNWWALLLPERWQRKLYRRFKWATKMEE